MGRIAPGHLADFALLDKDYFSIPESQIKVKDIMSVLTIMDGMGCIRCAKLQFAYSIFTRSPSRQVAHEIFWRLLRSEIDAR